MSEMTSTLIRKDDRGELIPLLKELAEKRELTPKKLVELGRDPSHALHKYFQWHDDIAAERYRENQARQLIQSVRVRIVTAPTKVASVRAIVSLPPAAESGETERRYSMIADVAAQPDEQRRMRDAALAELARIRRKYEDLAAVPEFAAVFAAVDRLAGAAT